MLVSLFLSRRWLGLMAGIAGVALVAASPVADVNAQVKVKIGVNKGFSKAVGFKHGVSGHRFNRFGHSRFGHSHFGHSRFSRFGHSRFGHSRYGRSGVGRFGHSRYGRGGFVRSGKPFVVSRPVVRERTVVIREPSRVARADPRFVAPSARVSSVATDPYAARASKLRVDPAESALRSLAADDHAAARRDFARAASLNPERAADKIGFGLASALQGDHETAAFAFARARAIDGDDAFISFPVDDRTATAVRDRLKEGVPAEVAFDLRLIASGPTSPYDNPADPWPTVGPATQPASYPG